MTYILQDNLTMLILLIIDLNNHHEVVTHSNLKLKTIFLAF